MNPTTTAGNMPKTIEKIIGIENTSNIFGSKIANNNIMKHNDDGTTNGLKVNTAHCPKKVNFVEFMAFSLNGELILKIIESQDVINM